MHRRRKILSLLLALVFMAGLLPTVAPVHAHADSVAPDSPCPSNGGGAHNWVRNLAADCTHGGMETYSCSYCYAESTASHWVDALGHSWGAWGYGEDSNGNPCPAPTCTQGGKQVRFCSRCGESETQSVPALGHSWDSGTVTKAATCEAAGSKTVKCTRCGETKTESIPALGHAWDGGTVTKEATCTAEGSRSFTCQNDGSHTRTESIPALGHNYETTVTQEPTCTEAGKQTVACTRGDDTHEETIPALGHDWDAGETVEPHGLTEGSVTHTCKRCGVTETETIPVSASSLFNRLRDIPPEAAQDGFEWPDELVIVTQPVGGAIARDGGSRTLSIEVEGGEAPYTYEWRSVGAVAYGGDIRDRVSTVEGSGARSQSNAMSFVQGRRNSAAQSYQIVGHHAASTFYPDGLYGSAELGQTILDAVTLTDSPIFASAMANGDGPEYEVTRAGTYFCRVTDSVGQVKESDQVTVGYNLYIVQQPQNANLNGKDSVTLSCIAAGGTKPYTYHWIDENDEVFYESSEGDVEVSAEGEYICIVWDAEGNPAQSNAVTVYNAEPLWVEPAQTIYNMTPAEDNLIEFSFGGGTPPYTLEWYHYGVLYETVSFAANDADTIPLRIPEDGEYGLQVTDANGDTAYKTCMVFFDPLTIVKQPVGGKLPEDGYLEIGATVADGEAPYTFTLYIDGEKYLSRSTEGKAYSYKAYESGAYQLFIQDSAGRSAWSNTVIVEGKLKPIITRQPESIYVEPREDGQYSTVLLTCEAVSAVTGDDSNLEYYWETMEPGGSWSWSIFDQSPVGRVPSNIFGQHFRCKVIDHETDEYTYSEEVIVQIQTELRCEIIEVSPVVYGNNKTKDAITYRISGGMGTYHVKIYQQRITVVENFRPSTVNLLVGEYWLAIGGEHAAWVPTAEYIFPSYKNGEYTVESDVADYFIIVTDANGETYETPLW